MNKRWYDLDPTLSLAVSLMANADDNTKIYCAQLITKILNENNIKPINIIDKFIGNMQRWYDNKELSTAMETLRVAPNELKKQIALDIIETIQTL